MSPVWPSSPVPVRSVWASNFKNESANLRHVARNAQYVAIAVHYPGVVHHPSQDPKALTAEQRYALVKANVDDLKPLQLGIALYDSDGGYLAAWEFNLRDFRPQADPHDENSLAYLAGRGLDVGALRDHGVSADMLDKKLFESGLVGARRGRSRGWITYAGAYHVAYLLKIVTGGAPLPRDVAGFNGAVRRYLGDQVYDVAKMVVDCPAMPRGLEHIADYLGFHPPLGSPRLAAAAGVRALQVFMRLKYGELGGDVRKYRGLLKGLH
ncbi:probable CCR4-associated factor 1 homolog 11 [Triticum dicoccoides]|uniref:probable CCR4-associated factor 1 homolog 11 n=1 Tax=Triticum dicoccoides TaxID=85692 RepID=UPI00188F563D|nr:probable CCR4-associated factor 1 homolog 11 [Triticum dicoccoides]